MSGEGGGGGARTWRRSTQRFPPSTSSLNNLVRAISLRSKVLATHFKASFDASGVDSSFVASDIRHFRFGADARTSAPWGFLPRLLTAERADNASTISRYD